MEKLLVVHDSAAGNGYDPVERLRRAGYSVDGLDFRGWVNLFLRWNEDDQDKLRFINDRCFESIADRLDEDRYDLLLIDGAIAYSFEIGYDIRIDGGLIEVPRIVASPRFPSDVRLGTSGCDFGWDGNGEIEKLVECLLDDPIERGGLGESLYFNQEYYEERDGLILSRN